MGLGRALIGSAVRMPRDEQSPPLLWPVMIVYAAISGVVALVMGAVASLAVSGEQRLAWWAGVTAAVAIIAGIAYESRPVRFCRLACRRWLRWLSKFPASS